MAELEQSIKDAREARDRHVEATDDKADVILHHGERVLSAALEDLRHLTPEGWTKFKHHAMKAGWHTTDLEMIAAARLLSMRAGGRGSRFGVRLSEQGR